jgi:16S rRNA (adenine1518-N6/adenine1519-N6)-dimethyltransferase
MQKIYHAKKSLGQNFLKSEAALRKIIEVGEISPDDIILEIGPGKGILTKKLLEKARKVIAVEKDKNLVEFLQEKFSEEIKNQKLILLEDDILEFDLSSVGDNFSQVLGPLRPQSEGLSQTIQKNIPDSVNLRAQQNILEGTLGRSVDDGQRKFSPENFRGESENVLRSYKIIANIPYNITGAILKKFLGGIEQPSMMVLMAQNEVAKRIMARDKKESILSISVKAYGTPKLEMKVPARYFSPSPKVDSAIISIKNISRDFFVENKIHEEEFWKIIHAGFAHKRKKLASNLKKTLNLDEKTKKIFEKLLGNKRAEDLTLSDWISLAKN